MRRGGERMEKRGEGGGGGTRVSCIFRDSNEIRDKWNARNSREAIKWTIPRFIILSYPRAVLSIVTRGRREEEDLERFFSERFIEARSNFSFSRVFRNFKGSIIYRFSFLFLRLLKVSYANSCGRGRRRNSICLDDKSFVYVRFLSWLCMYVAHVPPFVCLPSNIVEDLHPYRVSRFSSGHICTLILDSNDIIIFAHSGNVCHIPIRGHGLEWIMLKIHRTYYKWK